MGAIASPSTESQAEERGRVDRGGAGRGGAGRAWPRRFGAGLGSGVPREAGVGRRRCRVGCDIGTRRGWWRRRRTTLYNVWKRCEGEREKRKKERVGPGILAYVRQADTSDDEHKRAGLRGGRGTLCSSATR
jgi:hypothetical protein